MYQVCINQLMYTFLKHLAPEIVVNVLYIDFIIWFICILLY